VHGRIHHSAVGELPGGHGRNAHLAARRRQPQRSFPGDPYGSPTAQIADYIESVLLPQCDFVFDSTRAAIPANWMAFLGLVPSERSTGERVRRAGLTLPATKRARRVLIEGAWSYRYPARVSQTLQARLEGLPKAVREIAGRRKFALCAPLSPAQRRRQEACPW